MKEFLESNLSNDFAVVCFQIGKYFRGGGERKKTKANSKKAIFGNYCFYIGAGIVTRRPLVLQLIHVPKRTNGHAETTEDPQDREAYFDASTDSNGMVFIIRRLFCIRCPMQLFQFLMPLKTACHLGPDHPNSIFYQHIKETANRINAWLAL